MPAKRNPPKVKNAKGRSGRRPRPPARPGGVDLSLPARLAGALVPIRPAGTAAPDEAITAAQLRRIASVLNQVGVGASKITAALRMLEARSSPQPAPSVGADPSSVTPFAARRRETQERRRIEAAQHYENAVALEETDLDAAREAYLAALAAHSDHLEARINLGRLLHLRGDLDEAEKIYRAARHASAELSFNLGVLLEDLNREAEATVAYRQALALDPTFADAHFNLSRLHEAASRPQDAFRHLLAYRRHTRSAED